MQISWRSITADIESKFYSSQAQAQKVPIHLEEAFHEEVVRLVGKNVPKAVTEPTELVNSYLITVKNIIVDSTNLHSLHHSIKKKLQLCLDRMDLKETLEREPYYSRTVDELIAKFSGATVFMIVNLDKGYWQVKLHSDSRKYTCMALYIG